MSGLEKIILTSLNATSYEIEESKKSKGKIALIEKIKVFKSYIQNVYTYKVKKGLEKLSDERLSSYIEYLNRENITVDKAINEIHNLTDRILDNTEKVEDAMMEIDRAQEKLNKLTEKKKNIENELEEAEAEKQAREDFEFMQQESESDLGELGESDEMHEITLKPIEEEIQPVPIDTEVADSVVIPNDDASVMGVSEPVDQPLVINDLPVIEQQIEEQPEVQVEEKIDSPAEVQEEQPIATIQDEYIEAIDKIEQKYKEQFENSCTLMKNAFMEEAEKYANRQVAEITETAKTAITEANNNTKKALEEKAIVENDRDQYKTHYEQTLEVVKQKNEIIDTDKETIAAKDAEIEALKQELAKRDEIIANHERNEEELNSTLAEKDSQIANFKITIATIIGKDYTQSEVVEEPEVKTR